LDSHYEVEFTVRGDDFLSAGEASNHIKETLIMLGVPSGISRRASIITYEAEMNLVIHADGGKLRAIITQERLTIQAQDEGPGIPDLDLALQEGFSTAPDRVREMGFGAGMGLPNIKRNADNLEIQSEVGKGTIVTATILFPEGPVSGR